MISEEQTRKYCCEDISQIENYDKAVNDKTQIWDVHHRGEILPCGRFSPESLKKHGLYWNVPASQLIFLSHGEHMRLHRTGTSKSDETRRKMSEAKKGKRLSKEHRKIPTGMRSGWHLSDETKRKISEARKKYLLETQGTKKDMEYRRKQRDSHVGKRMFNNGIVNVWAYECPEGFVRGKLKHKI